MKVLILNDKKSVAKKVAEIITRQIKDNPKLILGLPTGETVIPLYKELSDRHQNKKIDFSKVKTFNLDEYLGLDSDDKNSFHYFMQSHLFKNVNVKPKNINFPPQKNPHSYDTLIKTSGGIDLTLLGIGRNGHIAFNEPGSSKKSNTRVIKLSDSTRSSNSHLFQDRKVPLRAVTLGITTILKSKKIILIATGKDKAEIIAKTLKAKPSPLIPASFLKRHRKTLLILDRDAASLVKNSGS